MSEKQTLTLREKLKKLGWLEEKSKKAAVIRIRARFAVCMESSGSISALALGSLPT